MDDDERFDLDETFIGVVPDPPDGMSYLDVAAWYDELRNARDEMTFDSLCASIPALDAIRRGLRVVRR